MCAQRKAEKTTVTEDKLIQANINGFGDDIGKITNRITAMFERQAGFDVGSKEYEMLQYRIACGQLFQQNAIDKIKGIVSKPMPKSWHDRHAINKIKNDDARCFYRNIVADKKPYFMRYIYPSLMKQYKTYIKNADKHCVREFRKSIETLRSCPRDELTDDENTFLSRYEQYMPVGTNSCVMNRICVIFERLFDGYLAKTDKSLDGFDCTIMKSGQPYTVTQYKAVAEVCKRYMKTLRGRNVRAERGGKADKIAEGEKKKLQKERFRTECDEICSNALQLCDIAVDISYTENGARQFCWDICGEEIVGNLLANNNNMIRFPSADDNGDIEFCGSRFTMTSTEVFNG